MLNNIFGLARFSPFLTNLTRRVNQRPSPNATPRRKTKFVKIVAATLRFSLIKFTTNSQKIKNPGLDPHKLDPMKKLLAAVVLLSMGDFCFRSSRGLRSCQKVTIPIPSKKKPMTICAKLAYLESWKNS